MDYFISFLQIFIL